MPERKRTNAEIDLLNSYLKEGETPLPYELDAEGNELKPIELTPEQKAEAEQKIKDDEIAAAKQKELDDAAESEKQRIIAEDAAKNKTNPNQPAPIELDDEKVLAYLKNKKGKELTSLDELLNPKITLTEEQKQLALEQREANKYAYGLSSGKFTKKELETFITDTKNPQDLVYAHYRTEQKIKYPELKDEDIKTKFEEKFSIDEGEESKDYEVGQTLINNIADSIIRKKHSKILNLENDYSSYENSQSKEQEAKNKVLTQAPLYKKDMEQIRSEIKKVVFQISKDEVFETELDDEIVNEVMDQVLDSRYSQQQIENGWNKDTIKQVVQTSGIIKQLPKLFKKYGDAQILKHQAGTRGVPADNQRGAKQGDQVELTDKQKQAIAFMKGEQTVAN